MSRFSKPSRFAGPSTQVNDLIDQLEIVFNDTTINNTVDVPDDSIDYDWIKVKVKEEVKKAVWIKYAALMQVQEFDDTSSASSVAIADKLNEIIKAIKA